MKKEIEAINKKLPKELLIDECLTESYFSNNLSWLLNPKANSNNVDFIDRFIKLIAIKRSKDPILHTKANSLKFGKKGNGTTYSKLNLYNSSVVREYHLPKSINGERNTNYCDVAIFDFDWPNPAIIAIENKLFGGVNNPQLNKYHRQCEKIFKEIKTREYVIIGLSKVKPTEILNNKNWIYLSWIYDIKPIVDKLLLKSKRYINFKSVLEYLLDIHNYSKRDQFMRFTDNYLNSITSCFLDEVNRIKSDRGNWQLQCSTWNQKVITHTSAKKKKLYIEYLSNFNIAIQSHSKNRKPIFEKVCIPFGLNERQLLNQILFFAKDIYKYHFGKNYKIYLGGKHKKNLTMNPFPKTLTAVFSDAYKYSGTLKHMMQFSKKKLLNEEYK